MLCDTAGVGREEDHTTHGFTLRASPAVKHSVSPPGAVGPVTAAGLIPQHIKTQKSAPNNSLTHIEKNCTPSETTSPSLRHHHCHTSNEVCTLSAAPQPLPSTINPAAKHNKTHASGGGAPCLTAGDTRAERRRTRGQKATLTSDTGGVALKA